MHPLEFSHRKEHLNYLNKNIIVPSHIVKIVGFECWEVRAKTLCKISS